MSLSAIENIVVSVSKITKMEGKKQMGFVHTVEVCAIAQDAPGTRQW